MAKSREINMNLLSVDDLFTTQEERDQKNQEYVKNISIYEITDFPNHPFKVKMDDKMLETIEMIFSIEPGIYIEGKYGVRVEDLVLVTEDGHELLNAVDKKYRIVG